MSKFVADTAHDASLQVIQTANQLLVCNGDPVDRAAAIAAALATQAMTPGDYTIGDGDVSGRKITVQQQADIDVTSSGQADTVVLIDASEMLLKTDLAASQQLTSGNQVTVNAYDYEVRDPT